jgi:ferredoxin
MKAIVDRDVCIGAAMCVATAPDAFELGGDGLARVTNSGDVSDEVLREAAEGCPVQAIILEDDEAQQIYP